MRRRGAIGALVVAVGSMIGIASAPEAPAAPTRDGKEWNELYPTTGLTWAQVATVCPTDGVTPCSGTVGGRNLTGWVWATAPQVLELFETYAPGISVLDPPVVNTFGAGVGFLNEFRWTTYSVTTYSYSEYASGWTASKDANGLPIGGGGGYDTPFFGGGIGLGSMPDAASSARGVFLWRTVGLDYTPPVITPSVSGTLGTNGWYRSDVAVSWSVTDPESAIVSTSGCAPFSVVSDTLGVAASCSATSAGLGGAASATVTVKRDATAPTVVCGATPTFSLTQSPATVSATVTDGLSGPVASTVTVSVSTAVAGNRSATITGTDLAGNSTTTTCPYTVTTPLCQGRVATIIGTGASETINGTAKADVIIGLNGSDTIYGMGGNDVICGGDGNDTLYGGGGNDDLDGGAGSDSIRGDAGVDRCTSGELRMSSCAVLY